MKIFSDMKKKIIVGLPVILFLVLTVFLFIPSQIYILSTIFNYSFNFIELLSTLIIFVVISFLSISFLTIFFPENIYKKIILLLFSLGIMIWIESNIMVSITDYGIFDGSPIDWNSKIIFGILDVLLWIFIFTFFIIKSKLIYKIMNKISLFFIIVQFITIIILMVQNPEPGFKNYYNNLGDNKFLFSMDKNVIIILNDNFQTDVFNEIIYEDDSYKGMFKDFTYFRNSLGGFGWTLPSVQYILTGKQYDNSQTLKNFTRDVYLSDTSLPKILKENNFCVNIDSYVSVLHFDERVMSNLKDRDLKWFNTSLEKDKIFFDKSLFDIVLFKSLPHFARKFFYESWPLYSKNDTTKLENVNRLFKFIDDFKTKSKIEENEQPIFTFYHLEGMHLPLVINEDLEYENLDLNRDNYKRQAKAVLKGNKLILDKLKELGIYDKSMILIIGDHGLTFGDIGIKLTDDLKNKYQEEAFNTNNSVVHHGIPLILIKPFNTVSEDITISDSPVTLGDIPKTVLSELKIENNIPNKSMFDINESDKRKRTFYFCLNPYTNNYINELIEYEISGFSWLESSWKKTGRVLKPNKVEYDEQIYKYGKEIRFDAKDFNTYKKYQRNGWTDGINPNGIIAHNWTDGKKAELMFDIDIPEKDLLLTVSLNPVYSDVNIAHTVNILINQKLIDSLEVSKFIKDYKITIPKEYIESSELYITFELPDAILPKYVYNSDSPDIRELSIMVNSIKLDIIN